VPCRRSPMKTKASASKNAAEEVTTAVSISLLFHSVPVRFLRPSLDYLPAFLENKAKLLLCCTPDS
jgi:hypothetical protein